MSTSNLAFVTILAHILCLMTVIPGGNSRPKSMHFVGSVDGKSFYAERKPDRSWQEASSACAEFGMRLASVDTLQQIRAISSYRPPEGEWMHWTSARDANTQRQFTWHISGAPLLTELPLNMNGMGYRTCLTYDFQIGYLRAYSCTDKLGTLCETIST